MDTILKVGFSGYIKVFVEAYWDCARVIAANILKALLCMNATKNAVILNVADIFF